MGHFTRFCSMSSVPLPESRPGTRVLEQKSQWCIQTRRMAYFLMKTDPSEYSVSDLERERCTVWDGVTNPQAVGFIRKMQPGDRGFIYHSGGESAIVALARIASKPRPDPGNPKSWVVDVEFERRIEPPVTLREIKASGRFGNWALVRQGRLSTMDVPEEFLGWMRERYPSLKL